MMDSRRWQPDATGWVAACTRVACPNADARPAEVVIDLLVLHAISLPPGQFGGTAIIDFFSNRLDPSLHPYFASIAGRRVSAHFLVRRDGAAIQFVACTMRAWHAGVSCWRGRERCNDYSIGIEMEGADTSPFTDAQYQTLNCLLAGLRASYPIAAVVGHADIAAARKTDPGPYFDWCRID